MKWLILILLVWLGLRLLGTRRAAPPAEAVPPRHAPRGEAMRACARCGLNVPASEALFDAEQRGYCSAAHRSLGPASGKRHAG